MFENDTYLSETEKSLTVLKVKLMLWAIIEQLKKMVFLIKIHNYTINLNILEPIVYMVGKLILDALSRCDTR